MASRTTRMVSSSERGLSSPWPPGNHLLRPEPQPRRSFIWLRLLDTMRASSTILGVDRRFPPRLDALRICRNQMHKTVGQYRLGFCHRVQCDKKESFRRVINGGSFPIPVRILNSRGGNMLLSPHGKRERAHRSPSEQPATHLVAGSCKFPSRLKVSKALPDRAGPSHRPPGVWSQS